MRLLVAADPVMTLDALRGQPAYADRLPPVSAGAPLLLLDPPFGLGPLPLQAAVLRRTRLYRLEHPQCGFLYPKEGEDPAVSVLYTPAGRLRQRTDPGSGQILSYYAEKKDHLPRLFSLLSDIRVVPLPAAFAAHGYGPRDIAVLDWQWGCREVLLQAWCSPKLRAAMENAPDKTYTACCRELDRIEEAVQLLRLDHPDELYWQPDGIYWHDERVAAVPEGGDASLPVLIMPQSEPEAYRCILEEHGS